LEAIFVQEGNALYRKVIENVNPVRPCMLPYCETVI
jgi:hypothetical protein